MKKTANYKIILAFTSMSLILMLSFQNCSKFATDITGLTVSSSEAPLDFEFPPNGEPGVVIGGGTGNPPPGLITGQMAFSKSVYLITRSKCIMCHETQNSPMHASADVALAYLAAYSKVDFINIENSTILKKIKDGHCGLPNCTTDGAEMLRALNNWKAFEKVTPVLVDAASTNGLLRHGGRKFVASRLRDIFGATSNTIVTSLIENDAGNFGDPCDKYSRDFNGNQNFGDCRDLAESQASLVGPATAARESLVVRVCTKITQDNAAVTNAVTLAIGATAITRAVAAGDIQAMYDLFYPGRLAASTTSAALKGIATEVEQKAYATIDQWRFILLTLCMSPDWQIP